MYRSTRSFFRSVVPVSISGMAPHAMRWFTTQSGDTFDPNPAFVASEGIDRIDVYCLHGAIDRVGAMEPLVRYLLAEGLHAHIAGVHRLDYSACSVFSGIADYARYTAEKIRANGHRKIVLIGHSRGGLIAAFLAEFLAVKYELEVLLVVTIGAPFGGTLCAWLLPLPYPLAPSIVEMRPGSDLLRKLNERLPHSMIRYCCIVARKDWVALEGDSVPASAGSKEGHTADIIEHHAHISILQSRAPVKIICRHLNALPTCTPEPAAIPHIRARL